MPGKLVKLKITLTAEEHHDSETGQVFSSYLIDEHANEGHDIDREAVLAWLGSLLEKYAADDMAATVPGREPERRRMMGALPCSLVDLLQKGSAPDSDDGVTLRYDTGGCSCCQA